MKCETCGSEVQVMASSEGTMHYVPVASAQMQARVAELELRLRDLESQVKDLEDWRYGG